MSSDKLHLLNTFIWVLYKECQRCTGFLWLGSVSHLYCLSFHPYLTRLECSTADHICEVVWSLEGKLLKRKDAVTVQYESCSLTFDMTNENHLCGWAVLFSNHPLIGSVTHLLLHTDCKEKKEKMKSSQSWNLSTENVFRSLRHCLCVTQYKITQMPQ